jgi:hypothetical protein
MKASYALLFLVLAACTDRGQETAAPAPETRPTRLLDAVNAPLDRAAGVEDTLRDSAADRRRQIEESEGR